MTETILKVAGVSKRFGGPAGAVGRRHHDHKGQVYGLIGPNGAGKTTFFNVLTGLYLPDAGSFELGGKPYKPSAVHEVAKAGIARTFQNIRLFAEMTALENVMVGRHVRTALGPDRRGLSHRAASSGRRRRSPNARRNCSTTWASASTPTSSRAR